MKVYITVGIILAAGILTLAFHDLGSNATVYRSEGILIDYGDYYTLWTDIDYAKSTNPSDMLEKACKTNSLNLVTDSSTGKPTSIDYVDMATRVHTPVVDDATHSWGLWTVDMKGKVTHCAYNDPIYVPDYNVVIWAYTTADGEPAVAVDSTNTSIYGYSSVRNTVTLSPVTTEIMCAVGGLNTIKGTDSYSDYPSDIVKRKASGAIAVVGTYLNPSYEAIINTNPDMVVCDGSSGEQVQMAQKIRNSARYAVVTYDAKDIKSIYDDLFIVATAMGYQSVASDLIKDMKIAIAAIDAKIAGSPTKSVMLPLGVYAAPYVAGSNTYADGIVTGAGGTNVFGNYSGWPLINAEMIPDKNPSTIIIMDSGTYHANEYDQAMSFIGTTTWKNTDAYKNGDIYLLADGAGQMSQRAGPRFVQFYELSARILNPDCFDDEAQHKLNLTKSIGSEYKDYLSYTKDLVK